MRLFRRRPPARHAAPVRRDAGQSAVTAAAAVPPWEQAGWTPPVPVTEPEPAPRVELGFRDGSTAALAPDSAQARALTAIADVLTQRD
jgi:hypothetical protein